MRDDFGDRVLENKIIAEEFCPDRPLWSVSDGSDKESDEIQRRKGAVGIFAKTTIYKPNQKLAYDEQSQREQRLDQFSRANYGWISSHAHNPKS